MMEVRRRRLATLQEYISSLSAGNPSWHHKAEQRNYTYSSRLEREDGCGRSEGVHRHIVPLSIPASAPSIHLKWSPEEGRHLVAAWDIAAGEEVFREAPLVLAPRTHEAPVCLACLAPLDANWPACGGCGAPLCSPPCDGKLHHPSECTLLAGLDLQHTRDHLTFLNHLLTPIRAILLIQAAPQVAPILEALQSNTGKRRQKGVAQSIEKRIVEMLARMGLEDDDNVVHHICGVFDTNAFMVGGGRALLPLAALMNHDCGANTQHWFYGGTLVVRAARIIPKGTAITNTYAPVLWGTHARAAFLGSSKFFMCRCSRCCDPTELGSHLSSVRCRQCQEGLLPPPGPTETVWQCNTCSVSVAAAVVDAMVRAAATAAKSAMGNMKELQTVVRQLSRLVGERHYVTVGAKHALIEATMKRHIQDLLTTDLEDVIDLCGDLLHVADLVDPGLSRLRGVMLLERVRAAAELLKRQTIDSNTTEPVITDTKDDEKAPKHSRFISLSIKCLKEAAEESENILEFDPRLPQVQDVLKLLEDLQKMQKTKREEAKEVMKE